MAYKREEINWKKSKIQIPLKIRFTYSSANFNVELVAR